MSRDRRRVHADRAGKRQLALGIVSTVAASRSRSRSASHDNLAALLVSWAGIVGVNVAHALQGRNDR